MKETRIVQVRPDLPGEQDDVADPVAPNVEAFVECLSAVGDLSPDFVCFPELALASGTNRHERPLAEIALDLPGPVTDRVGEAAAALDSYVWLPTYETGEAGIHNSVALIGPDGSYRGRYRKIAPTDGEIEKRGITPGTELPVWETEHGRVAATICWDVKFDEIALGYRAQAVDVMFHPTHGLGMGKLKHWSTYHGFHVVYCWTSDARVFAPHGAELGRATKHPTMPTVTTENGHTARVSTATINPNMNSFSMGAMDYDAPEINDLVGAYPEAIEVHNCYEEGVLVIESRDPDVDLDEVAAEFGLSTTDEREDYTRELVHDAVPGSPLIDPGDLDSESSVSQPQAEADD